MGFYKKKTIIITIILSIGGYFLAFKLYNNQKEREFAKKAVESQALFVPDYAVSIGPENAQVTIVEFLDPECESCRKFYPFVKEILKKNVGKLRLVIRYAPFHSNSEFAIRIVEAARMQDKYWDTLELLFKYQPQWGDHHSPKPELIWNFLTELDIDIEKLKQDMNSPRITSMLKQEMLDSRQLNVRATPTFFVNGKPLKNFGFEGLEKAVQEEL